MQKKFELSKNEDGTYALVDHNGEILEYQGEKQVFRKKITAINFKNLLKDAFFSEVYVKKLKRNSREKIPRPV